MNVGHIGELQFNQNYKLHIWKNKENHKKLFDWIKTQLGYKTMDDWYGVTQEDIYKMGGRTLVIQYYNGSPPSALQKIYPEHNWMLWRFKCRPFRYWERLESSEAVRMIEWLGDKLSIKHLDDWYRVSLANISKWIH